MSSPKLLAYKAIIEHASMLHDILNNPSAIKEAAKEYAEGFSLSEQKKEEAEKALQIIEDAKKYKDYMEKSKKEFEEKTKNTFEEITKQRIDLENLKSQCEEKKSAADKILDEAKKIKLSANDLMQQANNKLFDIEKREITHKKALEELAIQQKKVNSDKESVKHREDEVTVRENKIKEVFL